MSILELLADRQEITDRIADLAQGLDLADLPRYRRCFADTVEVRNPTFDRTDTYSGDTWAESVVRTQSRLAARVHALTSAAVELAGDTAEVVVTQHAIFGDDTGIYRVAGPLRLGFVRTPRGWRIVRLHFSVSYQDGDPEIYARARKVAA